MRSALIFCIVIFVCANVCASRNKEPLENFNIAQLSLKAVIRDQGQNIALVAGPNNVIYSIKVGNHIGKNNGLVYEIDSNFIKVVEVIRLKNKTFVEREIVIKVEAERK